MSPLILGISVSACLSTAALAFVILKHHNVWTTLRQRECCAELWASDALTCKDGTPCPLFDAKIGDSTPAIAIEAEAEALIESNAPVISPRHFVWPTIAFFVAVAGVVICCCAPFRRRQCDANAAQAGDGMGIEDNSDKGVSEFAVSPGDVQPSDDEVRVPSENDVGNTRAPAVAQAEARARAIAEEQAIAEAVEEAAAAAEAAAEAVAIAEAENQIRAESKAEEGVGAEAAAASPDGESIISASSVSSLENGLHEDTEAEGPSEEVGTMDDDAAIVHQNSGNINSTGNAGTGVLASESGVDVDQNESATLSSNANGATGTVASVVANGFPIDATAAAAVTPMENGEIYPRD